MRDILTHGDVLPGGRYYCRRCDLPVPLEHRHGLNREQDLAIVDRDLARFEMRWRPTMRRNVFVSPRLVQSVLRDAIISEDEAHRLVLARWWTVPARRLCLWIMLNPSTADACSDDATIRRCTAFSRAFGFDGYFVVNLFTFRSIDPLQLTLQATQARHMNAPEADDVIDMLASWVDAIIVAFGAHKPASTRGAEVCRHLEAQGRKLECLGYTKEGLPRHPLFVRKTAQLMPLVVAW